MSDKTGDDGTGPLVLVVEDEPQMRRFLRVTLAAHDYRVVESTTGAEGLVACAARQPDVVILDLGLPDGDGLDVLQKLRTWFANPVVVVSARHQEQDKVAALDHGADDYLTKPFGTDELLARLRVALRNKNKAAAAADRGTFVAGELRVDLERRDVTIGGKSVKLTPIEFRLLHTLIRSAGKVVTQKKLLAEVWGEDRVGEAHYLRVYMSALRRKIEADPARPRWLLTEQSVGYRLKVD